MEEVKNLYAQVNDFNAPLIERFPQLGYDRPVHIAYMSPMYNKQGLYRSIFPALELHETEHFSTIVTNIIDDECTKNIDNFNIKLIPEIIEWADYMVYPANTQNMGDLVAEVKKYNPFVQVVMDVDRLYHDLNPNNYATVNFRKKNPDNLAKNIKAVDLVTFSDKATEDYYVKLCGEDIKTAILPNLLSRYQFMGIDTEEDRKVREDGKKTILLIADSDDWDDINAFRNIIDELEDKVPNGEVLVLGNCLNFENKNPLRFTKYKQVRYKNIADYYMTLYNINADVCIIPVKNVEFYRPYYKLFEVASMGVPMVAMNKYPFNHLMTDKETILLAGQKKTLIRNINTILDNPQEAEKLAKQAQELVMSRYTFLNKEMLQLYANTFAPTRKHIPEAQVV